jgi:GNAT superfamily N-acetyltransferase
MSGPALLDSIVSKAPGGAVTIRRMAREEVQMAADWASDEGWNPGINDAEVFYQADPQGFFLALENGVPVGCCSAVVYEKEFAFFGLFIVRPGFRKRGIGLQLFRAAMKYVGERNCGLDGVVAMQSKYANFGFQPAYRNTRYEGSCEGRLHDEVVPLDGLAIELLEAYDRCHFSVARPRFLQSWVSQPGCSALGYVSDGQLVGYGVLRPCHVGYKIGPLFADTDQIADRLFQSLCASSHGASVFLDVPEPNEAAVALAGRYGMRPCFETARMYTKQVPDFCLDHIFGVTSFELG